MEELITSYPHKKRLELMQQAKGIWKDRDDLPSLEKLRAEFNRYCGNQNNESLLMNTFAIFL